MFDHIDHQLSLAFFRLQAVDNGVLNKGLDTEAGDFVVQQGRVGLYFHGYFFLKTHFLQVGIEFHIAQFIFQFHIGEILGHHIGLQQFSQGDDHLVYLRIVGHLGFPGYSVQGVEHKVRVHLGLQCFDLRVFQQELLLQIIFIVSVQFIQHMVEGIRQVVELRIHLQRREAVLFALGDLIDLIDHIVNGSCDRAADDDGNTQHQRDNDSQHQHVSPECVIELFQHLIPGRGDHGGHVQIGQLLRCGQIGLSAGIYFFQIRFIIQKIQFPGDLIRAGQTLAVRDQIDLIIVQIDKPLPVNACVVEID